MQRKAVIFFCVLCLQFIDAIQTVPKPAFIQILPLCKTQHYSSHFAFNRMSTHRKPSTGLRFAKATVSYPLVIAKHAAAAHLIAQPTLALWQNEIWVLTTCIILLGVSFEKLEDRVMYKTPKSFKPAISAMFNEFGALGFVSMFVFLITHPGHGPDAFFKVPTNCAVFLQSVESCPSVCMRNYRPICFFATKSKRSASTVPVAQSCPRCGFHHTPSHP
jgi:hypothetical protein